MVIISLPFHLLYIYYCPVNILKTLGIGYNSHALWGCGQKHAHGSQFDIGYNSRALFETQLLDMLLAIDYSIATSVTQ